MDFITELTASHFEGDEGNEDDEVDGKGISREEMLEAVKKDGYELKDADDSFKADREVVLEAVKESRWALQYASEELQNDPELKKLAEG